MKWELPESVLPPGLGHFTPQLHPRRLGMMVRAGTQALPGTVGRGWPVLPVPSSAVGTHPALLACRFPSQGDEWDAHPQARFGWQH